jgi:hypothetical protein
MPLKLRLLIIALLVVLLLILILRKESREDELETGENYYKPARVFNNIWVPSTASKLWGLS